MGKCGYTGVGNSIFKEDIVKIAVNATGKIGATEDGFLRGTAVLNTNLKHRGLHKKGEAVTPQQFKAFYEEFFAEEIQTINKELTSVDVVGFESDNPEILELVDMLNMKDVEYEDINSSGYLISNEDYRQRIIERKVLKEHKITPEQVGPLISKLRGHSNVDKLHKEISQLKKTALSRASKGEFANIPISSAALDKIRKVLSMPTNAIIQSGAIKEALALLRQLGTFSKDRNIVGYDTMADLAETILNAEAKSDTATISKNNNDLSQEEKLELATLVYDNLPNPDNLREDTGDKRLGRRVMSSATPETLALLPTNLLRALVTQKDNIENGYLNPNALKAMFKLDEAIKFQIMKDVIDQSKLTKVSISNLFAQLYSFKSDFTLVGAKLNSHFIYIMDQFLGNKKGRELYENTFETVAKANQLFLDKFRTAIVRRDLLESERQNYINDQLKIIDQLNLQNEVVKSNIKLSMFFIMRMNALNPTLHGYDLSTYVNTIMTKATRDKYKDETKDLVMEVYEEIGDKTWEEVEQTLTPPEQNIVKFNDEMSEQIGPILSRLATMHGKHPQYYNKYAYLGFIGTAGDTNIDLQKFQTGAGFDNPLIKDREHTSDAIVNLKTPLNNIVKMVQMAYMDFYLTPALESGLNITEKLAQHYTNERGTDQKKVADAIYEVFKSFAERDLANKLQNTNRSLAADILDVFEKTGYTIQLLSLEKTLAEIGVNLFQMISSRPSESIQGFSEDITFDKTGIGRQFIIRAGGLDIMDKLYGENINYNSHFRPSLNQIKGNKYTEASNNIGNDVLNFLLDNLGVNKAKLINDHISHLFFTKPERALALPLFWGTFQSEFAKLNDGVKLTLEQMKRIGDSETEFEQYQEKIEAALAEASAALKYHTAPLEVWSGVGKWQRDVRDPAVRQIVKDIDSFMQRFQANEYAGMITGLNSALGEGPLTVSQGFALLRGNLGRQILYFPLLVVLQVQLARLWGEDDDDFDFMEKLKFSTLQAIANIVLMRNLGSIGREFIGHGLEGINQQYLQVLRDGKGYDPYKHSLAFRVLSDRDVARGDFLKFSGKLSPFFRAVQRIRYSNEPVLEAGLAAAAFANILPFYKNLSAYRRSESYRDLQRYIDDKTR